MRKRILLTGANGFVGSNILGQLSKEHDVLELSQDLTKPIKDIGSFDAIVNLASISSVPRSIAEPRYVITTNMKLALNVFEYARKYGIPVIHLSSVEANDSANPYAASKAAQEAIARAYHHTYGIQVTILVSNNIVGPNQTPDKFIPKIIEQIKSGDEVSIYRSDGVVGSRIYNTVNNVASAINYMLKFENINGFYRYLIDGGQELDNLVMAQSVAARLGRPLRYAFLEAADVRPGYTRFLSGDGQFLSGTGWEPPETLQEGLAWIEHM